MRCWLLQVNIGSVYSYLFNGSDLFLETTVPSFGGKRLDGHLIKSKVIHRQFDSSQYKRLGQMGFHLFICHNLRIVQNICPNL